MKFDGKVLFELSLEEANILSDFICEFESDDFGGTERKDRPKGYRTEWIQEFHYGLVLELEKHRK